MDIKPQKVPRNDKGQFQKGNTEGEGGGRYVITVNGKKHPTLGLLQDLAKGRYVNEAQMEGVKLAAELIDAEGPETGYLVGQSFALSIMQYFMALHMTQSDDKISEWPLDEFYKALRAYDSSTKALRLIEHDRILAGKKQFDLAAIASQGYDDSTTEDNSTS